MTREEAKRRLLNIERCTPIHTREDVRDFEALEMAIKALEQNESAEEWYKLFVEKLEQESKWIPVSERLPEKDGRYLAYIVNEYDNQLQYIMTCDYMVDGHWHWFPDDECASDNVIAWMPLPQPYKPQESEG